MGLDSENQEGMNVLQMCSYLRSNKFHTQCFESISKRQVNQTVVSPLAIPEAFRPQSNLITEHYGDQRNWPLSRKLIYSWKMKDYDRHLRQLTRFNSVHIVHAHSLYADGLAAWIACKSRKLPLVISIRGGDVTVFPKYYPHWRTKVRKALKAASKIVFSNHKFKPVLEKTHNIRLPSEKCLTIPNGVEDLWHNTPLRERNERSRIVRIICAGKLTTRKNQLGLIAALKIANQTSDTGFSLTLVGKPIGVYGQSVLKECRENEWITYLGELSPNDMVEQFQKHDLFALISHAENFGIVYAEALSCGLPIIFSKGQGFDGWSSSFPYGVSVDSRDTASAVDAILNYDFDLTSAIERKEFAANLFTWSRIALEHESLYRSILDNA